MLAELGHRSRRTWPAVLALVVALGCATPQVARPAPDPPASDLLNAGLWMHRSVGSKAPPPPGSAPAGTARGRPRAAAGGTGARREQPGPYQALPPAVILDL